MKKTHQFIFISLLILIAYYYGYWDILQKRPQSIHRWRQTDCASIALNYYQHGMNFFKPEVLFQISDGGKSGYTVGECPLLYYFIAILWKLFGYSDFIYRLVNTIIFGIGLIAFYKIAFRFLNDFFWSAAITILFFTSPVVIYYAANYLTDTTALALVLVGWNFIFKYVDQKQNKFFYWAFLFFTIAGLIKVSALISVVALIGIMILKTLKIKSDKIDNSFALNYKKGIAILSLFVSVFLWYCFAVYYNNKHIAVAFDGSPYFSTQTFPIWDLKKQDIIDILKEVKHHWIPQYYNISAILFYILSGIFIFAFIKKMNLFLSLLLFFVFIGVINFSMLWFYAFAQHDYYIISLLILPILILITFFEYLLRQYQRILNFVFSKILFTIFIVFNMFYAKAKLNDRYNGWENDFPINKALHAITPYLRQLGIQPTDKVITLPDPTTCYTLYLMNQPGWSGTNFFYDSLQIEKYIGLGANYLIINDEKLLLKPGLQPFIQNQIGKYGSVLIFSLQKPKILFQSKNIFEKEIKYWGKETIREKINDGKYTYKMDSLKEYSPTFVAKINELTSTLKSNITVRATITLQDTLAKPILVIAFQEGEKLLLWKGEERKWAINKKAGELYASQNLSELELSKYPNATVSIYIWNNNKKPFIINTIDVKLIEGRSLVLN